MKTIIVQNNKVINIIKSTKEYNEELKEKYQHVEEMPKNQVVQIGATWNGSIYVNPKENK